jgi:hypothetical protein
MKLFKRFILALVVIFLLLIVFLSYFGLETKKLNNLIQGEANKINQNIKLDFEKSKIHLNIIELNILVKLHNSQILIKQNKINLSKLYLFLPIKSFFSDDFILRRVEVAFIKNDIKDLSKITKIFLPTIINNRLNKIFEKGKINGEFVIPFNPDGSVGKNYGFTGKLIDTSLNLSKDFEIKKLSADISHSKNFGEDKFELDIKKGFIYELDLVGSNIEILKKKNLTLIESSINTKGTLNFKKINRISSLLSKKITYVKDLHAEINLQTDISFVLDKYFRIKNLVYLTSGSIPYLELSTHKKNILKKYLPDFKKKIIFKKLNIKIKNSKLSNFFELNGLMKLKDGFDNFSIKRTYESNEKVSYFSGSIDFTNIKVNFPEINFFKESGEKSNLTFNLKHLKDKYTKIKKLTFESENNKILITHLNLNQDQEVVDFKNIQVKTFIKNIKNNDFLIKKNKEIKIVGSVFDSEPLLKSIYKTSENKIFSKNFSADLKVNFDKVITGSNDDLSDFAIIGLINKGAFDKLSLKGKFSENEILEISIYKIDNTKKTLQIISDRARPFIKSFDFIKGFDDGKLEYESTIEKEISKSSLIITDFKVSEVPALAQLLTLASLQGIADTLSGEGIRFDTFEMTTNSVGNVLNIDDALAMGPAVSILLNGYVDKGNIVSLRGTLVPATKLNALISKIPLVGNILVGKKTGEGVVGVSFKMKGPPRDIKTSVNPIKTITPRFIVRAVEKMKKEKKNNSK